MEEHDHDHEAGTFHVHAHAEGVSNTVGGAIMCGFMLMLLIDEGF